MDAASDLAMAQDTDHPKSMGMSQRRAADPGMVQVAKMDLDVALVTQVATMGGTGYSGCDDGCGYGTGEGHLL
jgi:hypothetical protein